MNILVPRIRESIRKAINAAFQIPSTYSVNIHTENSGSPVPTVKNAFKIKVIIRIYTIALTERRTTPKGIFVISTRMKVPMKRNANDARLLQRNEATIWITASIIFTLPSML
jgi:hypothetical protein